MAKRTKKSKQVTRWTLQCGVDGSALTVEALCQKLAKYGIEKVDEAVEGKVRKIWLADHARRNFLVGIVPFPTVNGTVLDFELADSTSENLQRFLDVIGAVCKAQLVPVAVEEVGAE